MLLTSHTKAHVYKTVYISNDNISIGNIIGLFVLDKLHDIDTF